MEWSTRAIGRMIRLKERGKAYTQTGMSLKGYLIRDNMRKVLLHLKMVKNILESL